MYRKFNLSERVIVAIILTSCSLKIAFKPPTKMSLLCSLVIDVAIFVEHNIILLGVIVLVVLICWHLKQQKVQLVCQRREPLVQPLKFGIRCSVVLGEVSSNTFLAIGHDPIHV
jgi:hypothetical protein